MGRTAQPGCILRFIVFLSCAIAPLVAEAAATAQGVALSASAGCSNANLDLTLTTSGATTELGQWTKTGDNSVSVFKTPTTALASFGPGTFQGYKITISPQQPANTLIGAYAYVGDDPPAPPTLQSSSSITTAPRARCCSPATVPTEPARRLRSRQPT